ncbi:C40 family peptidase [Olsenella sp. TM06-36]|uniref:C40 family peptidase n=1 Tax=Olsenella sp. TM06-36 TaxID=2292361 RepID=UPI0013141657|nr:C40 family peptidase [Olsenella sp. TM06-36]
MTHARCIITAGLVLALATPCALTVAPTVAMASPEDDLSAASAKLDSLGSTLSSLQDQLSSATSELEQTTFSIADTEQQISDTQTQLDEKRQELGTRMKSSYKSGSSSALDLILSSASFEELSSNIYYLDKVSEADAAAISEVQALSNQLEQQKSDLEQQQADQQAQVDSLQSQTSDYQNQVAEAQAYYDSLNEEVQAQLAAEAAAAAESEESNSVTTVVQAIQTQETINSNGGDTTQTTTTDNSTTSNTSSNTSNSSNSSSSTTNVPSGGGVSAALALVGHPYVYGASGPNAFDCSGLVCYVYGYARGRTTYAMINSIKASGGWKTSTDQLSYGDLVFEYGGSHVGIYIGNGQIVHAANPSSGVIVGPIYGFYGGGSY